MSKPKTCYVITRTVLQLNPDREYTTEQMRKHMKNVQKVKYSHSMVGWTLRQLHNDGVAERIRDGREPYRYSLADTN